MPSFFFLGNFVLSLSLFVSYRHIFSKVKRESWRNFLSVSFKIMNYSYHIHSIPFLVSKAFTRTLKNGKQTILEGEITLYNKLGKSEITLLIEKPLV